MEVYFGPMDFIVWRKWKGRGDAENIGWEVMSQPDLPENAVCILPCTPVFAADYNGNRLTPADWIYFSNPDGKPKKEKYPPTISSLTNVANEKDFDTLDSWREKAENDGDLHMLFEIEKSKAFAGGAANYQEFCARWKEMPNGHEKWLERRKNER